MSDAAAALQAKINQSIPLSAAMGYRISELADTRILVTAPLAPNVNIHGTGFAGSIYAVGILTAWGLCAHLIERAGLDAELVVAEASIRYRAPIRGDIRCRCEAPDNTAQVFTGRLADKGRSRILLEVEVGDGPAATIDALMHASLR